MKTIEAFKKFVLRGNIMDLAIGFTVGAAFTTVAKSLVNDIIMPLVGLLLGYTEFTNWYIVLRQGAEELPARATLEQAQATGAITLNYGMFLSSVLALLLVALVMFFFVRSIKRIDDELDEHFGAKPDTPANKKCPFCRSTIDFNATRCPQCTSQLDESAEKGEAE